MKIKFLIFFILIGFSIMIGGCVTASLKGDAKGPEIDKSKEAGKQDNNKKDDKKDKNKKDKKSDNEKKDGTGKTKENKPDEEKKPEYYDGLKYEGPAEKEFSEGLGKYFTGGCSEAIETWKGALDKDEERFQIAFNIALCYQRLNNEKESRIWFEKAFTLNPEFTKPLYNMVLMLGDRIKNEMNYFLELINKTQDEVEKNNFIAWLYLQNGDLNSAEKYAKMVLKLDEQNSNAVISLATVYYSKKMYELAQTALTTAEKWDSENFALHRLFGFLLYDMGDKKNATVHLQKAIKINPELPEVRNILAVLSMEIEDFSSAKEHLEFALKIAPDFKQAKVNLAIACKGLSDFKRSKELLLELENDKSVDIETMKSVIFNSGILYLDADVDGDKNPGKFDTAVDYFNKYLKLIAKDSDFKKEKVLIDGYIKESYTEKKKQEFYLAKKIRDEKKKKDFEEEHRLFLENKEKAFENAMSVDKLEVWEQYLTDYPVIDENDKMGLAATARLQELKKEPASEPKTDKGKTD
ncbi:MAG TPA: hypothetical protein PKG52_00660 [bacterium]|nr:hypothetical protein [bacterium]HPS29188.1 hypothetical protein [bacterium]